MQQGGLGEYIRMRRKELGMSSQDDLAEATGLEQRRISNIEQGRNLRSPLPPPDEFTAIARALRVTESDLLRAAGYLSDDIAARRLDDHGDEYAAAQDRWAAEHPDEVQRIADRIRQVVIDELDPERAEREEPRQLNFGVR